LLGIKKAGRWFRRRDKSDAQLPAPGPNPLARADREDTLVLIVISSVTLWLLSHGYDAITTERITAAICLFTALLTGRQPVISSPILSKITGFGKLATA
jgi:hypothetical protein